MSELKKCPFCNNVGKVAEYEHWGDYCKTEWAAGCLTENCIAEWPVDVFYLTKEKATEAWNTRASTEEVEE